MKLGQLIELKKRNIFIQLLYKKCGRKTSSRPLFIFQKSVMWVKASDSPQLGIQ